MKISLFDNTEIAFQLKTNTELKRAYYLFSLIGSKKLVKIGTSLTNFALSAKLPVKWLIRATVFDHFCGGETEEESLTVIDNLYNYNVSSVLDYSVEGKATEKEFDATLAKKLKIVNFCVKRKAMPFVVFKPTGLGRFYIFEKKTAGKALTESETKEWENITNRFDAICSLAQKNNVKVLIDGEETWMQDAADDLVQSMMEKYNTETAVVHNTLQCYRWDRLDYLKQLHQQAKAKQFKIGVKIVRGAYMEKERKRAEDLGYQSPICKDKDATDAMFNNTLQYALENQADISMFIGTHNAESCIMAMNFMKNNNQSPETSNVWFGQLYGMSDHISFNLAQLGYNVAKNLPFGPVRDVMPYLIRRAEENTSVAGQTSRELQNIKTEMDRRGM